MRNERKNKGDNARRRKEEDTSKAIDVDMKK